MAYVDWMIGGWKISACSCDYGCPCEFNAPPTNRDLCEGMEVMHIDEGHFGDVGLAGVRFGAAFRWPGPVHKGGGIAQGFVDEGATEKQVEALFQILEGKEQEPTTVFNIYGSTIETEYDPVFAKIEFECDPAARSGSFKVPGAAELTMEPIKNPVTGKPHRAVIRLPEGFEFRDAEMASATFKGTAELTMDHADSYCFVSYLKYGPYGVID